MSTELIHIDRNRRHFTLGEIADTLARLVNDRVRGGIFCNDCSDVHGCIAEGICQKRSALKFSTEAD